MKDFGIQMFSIREGLTNERDFAESVKKISDMGYRYAHTAKIMIDERRYFEILRDHGMTICGTHYPYAKICEDIAGTVKLHHMWQTDTVGIGYMQGLEEPQSLAAFVKRFNELARIYASEGLKLSYHNHAWEFSLVRGTQKTVMEHLYEELDPENITFVLDTCWVQAGGGDVRYWIEKLHGRMDILHLKDCRRCLYDDDPKKQGLTSTELGRGNLWIEGILESAEKAGVKYYVVEQDFFPGDPFESMRISAEYLKCLIKP